MSFVDENDIQNTITQTHDTTLSTNNNKKIKRIAFILFLMSPICKNCPILLMRFVFLLFGDDCKYCSKL